MSATAFPRPLPALRPMNPTNAQGGVTLLPGAAGYAQPGRQSMDAYRGMVAIPPPAPPQLPMGHGGHGGHGGGGWSFAPDDGRRIDGHATPAMTTADWIAQNEALGGRGLTPSYGSMGALPMPPAAFKPSAPPPGTTIGADGRFYAPGANPEQTDWLLKPKPMANGGMMPPRKPVLVGEDGPELILPRADGSHFVLPADITAQVHPAFKPVPKADGGVMESVNNGMHHGAFATLQSPYGGGFGSRIGLNPVDLPRGMADERGMINPATMQPMPDVVPEGNPWRTTSGIMPRTEAMEQVPQAIAAASQRTEDRFRMVPAGQAGTVTVDGKPMIKADALMAMRERGAAAVAGMEAQRVANDFATREARLAADAARRTDAQAALMAPFAGIPGMTPALAARATRNVQNFLKTPQGSMWAMQQGMRAGEDNVTGAGMLPVGDAGFVPIVRDASGNARMAGGFIPTARTQQQPATQTLETLTGIMLDGKQDLAQRETARRQYQQLTGVNIPLPKPADLKGKRGSIAMIPGPMMEDPITKKQVPGPDIPVLVDTITGTYRPLQHETPAPGTAPEAAAAKPAAAGPAVPSWKAWLDAQK